MQNMQSDLNLKSEWIHLFCWMEYQFRTGWLAQFSLLTSLKLWRLISTFLWSQNLPHHPRTVSIKFSHKNKQWHLVSFGISSFLPLKNVEGKSRKYIVVQNHNRCQFCHRSLQHRIVINDKWHQADADAGLYYVNSKLFNYSAITEVINQRFVILCQTVILNFWLKQQHFWSIYVLQPTTLVNFYSSSQTKEWRLSLN